MVLVAGQHPPCSRSRFRQITGNRQGSGLCPWDTSSNRLASMAFGTIIGREHTWERESHLSDRFEWHDTRARGPAKHLQKQIRPFSP